MKILVMFLLIVGALFGMREFVGFWPTYKIAYGAFSLLAAGISATFLWLWLARKEELSLGMALSWAGAAGLNGSWYLSNLFDGFPIEPSVLTSVALYATGAVVHIWSFQRVLRLPFLLVILGPTVAVLFGLVMFLGFD